MHSIVPAQSWTQLIAAFMLTFHHLISYMHLLLPFTAPCQCMQASLHDLNTHLDIPISMNRFRPNIVLDGEQPAWAEDQWGNRNICVRTQEGSAVDLEMCKPCSRCTVSLHALLNSFMLHSMLGCQIVQQRLSVRQHLHAVHQTGRNN